MSKYTAAEITEFLAAANRVIGSDKYSHDPANELIPDCAKAVKIALQIQAELVKSEKDCLDEIKNRDHANDLLQEIDIALGADINGGWSNMYDCGEEALAKAKNLQIPKAQVPKRPPQIPWKIKLEALLKQIGWTLWDRGCGHYRLCNHKGESTAIEFQTDHLDIKAGTVDTSASLISFYLSDCKFRLARDKKGRIDMLCITGKRDKNIFIQLYNFDPDNCEHINTHKGTLKGTDIEVCDDCGMSRSIWEQGESNWKTVDLSEANFPDTGRGE